ncbi:2-succinyl-5-enolpyruvyl-6-hydroxy-3-cyclohexene-1-carboxylic-acid synthase [Opitutus sp. GAS368]|uniref:2-succinyl-5-enolpyruvyl-6-hydroxy-3- cyclohexene-1-carboxylic-acid synthase n=1 Tax=Opitutus sp. GAS368 TaxID=1882749 RepID=UPI00087BD897|nr:2-succinyl-5-enolpyruvyl-6-hydroxy-3-cyclohexene-1-carboxylic-acid synthase [Opitutus sp. GAS368]SDS55185.1 2-succinyl-5-enolpyruvyl-6-hydroxy-3-cyclohexene-1-carboxylate synthase [Opitutus sp. GAS368]
MHALDYRNPNSLWGSVLVETLHRLGLREVVISPGSRSTPLTMAFARHPGIEAIPVLDERSAAFFALGLARQHQRPVALLCTSGTAGANYFPAVIEAQESGVPLLVLTADRPPEMRECRSGQTIDQQKLYGSHVNFYHEFAVPQASLPMLRYLRQTTAHAWERTQWPSSGPVHLNAPFRDPLPPIEDGQTGGLRDELDEQKFFVALKPRRKQESRLTESIRLGGRGVIVAGQVRTGNPAAYARTVGKLARKLGWPVLADALSPLRHHARLVPGLVTTYDCIARSEALAGQLRPDRVLCLHDWPTSKALRQWLQAGDAEVTLVRRDGQNPDALHSRTTLVRASVESLAAAIRPGRKPRGWLDAWLKTDRRLARGLARELAATEGLFEGRASGLLPGLLPKGTPLFVANSMPVRDLEYFCPANNRGLTVHCNRGANGIDGTLSTALGLAHGNRPAVLLTGDLALLHDTNGFLTGPKFKGSLTVVLINNDGGGIFGHLPVAQFNPPFEEFFATPQQADFRKLCAAYGCSHSAVRDWKHFAQLLARRPARGVRVLEVRTDRKRDAATRRRIFAQLAG